MDEKTKDKTALLVEDEHQVRTHIALLLEQLGYRVLEAAHSNEGANIWRSEAGNIDVVITDIWLPGISGPELVGFLRRDQPQLKALFITGMSREIGPDIRELTRNSATLEKPFTKDQLAVALREVFEA
jgi:CheY-like chemotaxis protein